MVIKNKLSILSDLRVLYIQDNTKSQKGFEETLEFMFTDVIYATDGKTGFKLFEDYNNNGTNIDIILVDINLDGLETVKNIKKLNNEIPVVFLITLNDSEYMFKAIESDTFQYLLQPTDAKNLTDKLYLSYLPIYQKNVLTQKNLELKKVNENIIKATKQEAQKFFTNEDEYIQFESLIDNFHSN